MKYFNGFSLVNEESFFKSFINECGEYCIVGFSYGAIKAFLYTKEQLKRYERVDKLILLSPAFFQTKSQKFKTLQLRGYQKNPTLYIKNFLKACFAPYPQNKVEFFEAPIEDLEELLFFQWEEEQLFRLQQQGVFIEVYLGGQDQIIDPNGAFEFFSSICDTTLIQEANHFLEIKGEF